MSSNTCTVGGWLDRDARTWRPRRGCASTYHGGHAPYVGASSPFGAEDHLGRAVLACLNVIGEVVVYPAGIPEVGNLDTDNVAGLHVVGLALLAGCREGRGRLVQ